MGVGGIWPVGQLWLVACFSKVTLETHHPCLLCVVYGRFPAVAAEMSVVTACMGHRAENIDSLAHAEKVADL